MLIEVVLIIVFFWISFYDVKNHLIRNIDLLLLLALILFRYSHNLKFAAFSLVVYLIINFISSGKIGYGDIKLSFVLALLLDSFFKVYFSIAISWVFGGIYALFRSGKAVPFAPFMIFGTYLARFYD